MVMASRRQHPTTTTAAAGAAGAAGTVSGTDGLGRNGLHAALVHGLREREVYYSYVRGKSSVKQVKPLLVVVESERRSPTALDMIVRTLSLALYGSTDAYAAAAENRQDPRQEMLGDENDVRWAFRVGDRGTVISHIYRMIASRGERGALEAVREIINNSRCDKGSVIVVNGIPAPTENSSRNLPMSSISFHSRMCTFIVEEADILIRIHAPRMDHSQENTVVVSITTNTTKMNNGKTEVYLGRVGSYGIESLQDYHQLSLNEALRLHSDSNVSVKPNSAIRDHDGFLDEPESTSNGQGVVLPYEHRGNSMTASGKMEDFLPKSAGGKLKDKNNKPGVIFYTRDSDDEVYDSDEDPDDDLDI